MTQPAQSIFRASEIVDMAIRIENQGVNFYQTCLTEELPEKVREVLQYLLEQEYRHIKTFEEMRKDLSDYSLPESYAGEIESYIKSFVKNTVFTPSKKSSVEAAGLADPYAAIDFGLLFEERSINFYQEMKKIVPESEREAIEKVINEERDHKRQLASLRKEISDQ